MCTGMAGAYHISDMGAKSNGPVANPIMNVVIPSVATTREQLYPSMMLGITAV